MSDTMTSGRRARGSLTLLASTAICCLTADAISAQEMELPVEIQMTMISRIFAFDRSFEARVGEELVLAIAYQGRNRESFNALTAAEAVFSSTDFQIRGMPVRLVAIDVEIETDLEDVLRRHAVDLMYVAPLRSADVKEFLRRSHSVGVGTLSGVPAYADDGAMVSLGRRAARPEIIINLASCRTVGVRFSSRLLEMARIVEDASDG